MEMTLALVEATRQLGSQLGETLLVFLCTKPLSNFASGVPSGPSAKPDSVFLNVQSNCLQVIEFSVAGVTIRRAALHPA
jgi:hypothetical protein